MSYAFQDLSVVLQTTPMGIWNVFESASHLFLSGERTSEDSPNRCTPNLEGNVDIHKPLFASR